MEQQQTETNISSIATAPPPPAAARQLLWSATCCRERQLGRPEPRRNGRVPPPGVARSAPLHNATTRVSRGDARKRERGGEQSQMGAPGGLRARHQTTREPFCVR